MQRRIAAHVLFLSALSQIVVSCPGQYLGDGSCSDIASGMAGPGGGQDMLRAPVMSLGGGSVADGLRLRRDYESGISIPSSWTQGTYPQLVGRYGVGQGLSYGSEVGPSYGRYEVGQGLGYGSEVGPSYGRYGIGQGIGYGSEVGPFYGYGGRMDPGFVYGGGMVTPGASAMSMDGSYGTIGSKYPPSLGYGGPLGIANTGTLDAGVTSYPIGGLSYAPVNLPMMVGSAVPLPQQRAVLNANENTNTNVNINNNMGKHRARLVGRGLLGTPQI